MQLHAPELLSDRALIAGEWLTSASRHPVYNPATGEVIAQVARCGASQTQRAIDAAAAALPGWQRTDARTRGGKLRALGQLMLQHQKDLALLVTLEQGKPLVEARGEILYAASFLEWFADEARRGYGCVIPPERSDLRQLVTMAPIGVCALITPWNFPSAMITRKLGAALAAGCSVVLKPAEATPLSALALGKLCEQVDLPPGLVNIVTGNREDANTIGNILLESETVRKLSFTGSTAVGKALLAKSAQTVKRVSLELGGNAPFVVFRDANIPAAVRGALACKFRNAGQTCVSANRFLVDRTVMQPFTEQLTHAAKQLSVGQGIDPGVSIGPLINDTALAKVERHVADAIARGASLHTGGQRAPLEGNFYPPTVLSEVTSNALNFQEETFGPVAFITSFDEEQEAYELANRSRAGLAAYAYTTDPARTWRASEKLEFGMVGINTGMISSEVAPFGGIKESGHGREGSKYGMAEYLDLKYTCFGEIKETRTK